MRKKDKEDKELQALEKKLASTQQITIDEYDELLERSAKLDRMLEARRRGGRNSWKNLTPEQRTARAKHAVAAREEKRRNKKNESE